MSALSTSTSFQTFADDDSMLHSLPKLGETRCYWSLLSSELDFIYLDPAFASHLENQADLLIGKSLLSFIHPEEQATARADIAEALEQWTMDSSVTRVRYCRLSRIRRILGHQGPSQPWPDGDKVSIDASYMVVDVVINRVAQGLMLCFIHAVVDLEPGDNDEYHRTAWTNWCGTPWMHPEQIALLQQRLLYFFSQSTVATRVFQILLNSNHSQQEYRLLLSWPPDSSQGYPGITRSKDFAKRVAGIQTSARDNSAKTNCTRRWRIQDMIPGLGEVESLFVSHGSILFACHTIVQSASWSSPVSYPQSQPFTRSADAYIPAHSQHHTYDLSASSYTSISLPQSYGQYTSSLPSHPHSPLGNSIPSSSLSQFNRWPAESPAQSMTPFPSSSRTIREPPYSRPSPSPNYRESRASFSSYRSTPSPEVVNYSAKSGFEADMPPGFSDVDVVPPPRHGASPGTHSDSQARTTNNRPVGILKCSSCKATSSPEWRKGPSGRKELCNACGLRYARSRAKKEGHVVSTQRRKKEKSTAVTAKDECAVPSTPPIPITCTSSATCRGDLKRTSFTSTSLAGSGSGSEAYSPRSSTSSLPSQYSNSPWGSNSQPSSPLSQFNRWPAESPAPSMNPLPSSSFTIPEPPYSRPSPSPNYRESRASFSSYQSIPSPELVDYSATSGWHRMSPGTHRDSQARTTNNQPVGILKCSSCKAASSPEWRIGPSGRRELCNACGLRYARSRARKGNAISTQRQKENSSAVAAKECAVSSTSPIPIDGAASATRCGDLKRSSFASTSLVGSGSGSEAYSPPCAVLLGSRSQDFMRKTSTSPYLEITARKGQATQALSGSVSDTLQDLTNQLQGKSNHPVASGGFGDIWKCDLVKLNEIVQVAVKTIRAFESDNDILVRKKTKRVRRELNVWGRLKHDCILPLWGVAVNFGPYPAMVCPWVDNGTLTGFLERQQDTLSCQDKFSLLSDIADGLQYLHSKSIVHGDLTGSNVLVHGNGRACLADFGLSTIALEFMGTSYLTSSIRGNIRWAAAELFEVPEDEDNDEATVTLSAECDIYSFGSITLQVLTCKVPYYNVKDDSVVLGQVIRGKKPKPPKESKIASSHWELIQRCWLPRAGRPLVGEIVTFVASERGAGLL